MISYDYCYLQGPGGPEGPQGRDGDQGLPGLPVGLLLCLY